MKWNLNWELSTFRSKLTFLDAVANKNLKHKQPKTSDIGVIIVVDVGDNDVVPLG